MRCEKPGKCDKFEEVMMVKRTHGEKRHTIRGMGLARRKQEPCKRSVLRKSCTFIEIFFRNRLTKTRRDGKIYRQSAVAVKIESGRVPEWPMGTDCKSAAFQLRWFESTRAHQTRKIRTCFRLEKGSDFSFSSGTIAIRIFDSLATTANCMSQQMLFRVGRILVLRPMKAPVDGVKLRYLVIDRKPITRFGGHDNEV